MDDPELLAVLAEAQELGFLGKAPLVDHVVNGRSFASAIAGLGASRCVDLGSGGGVPALVVARIATRLMITCVDRGSRRCEFLAEAARALDLSDRVGVVEGDAEVIARLPDHDGGYDIATARSFGPPAVTAEAAARFLAPHGTLLVSEPPTAEAGVRWQHARALASLGLSYDGLVTADVDAGTSIARITRDATELDARYPRRAATVRKRPLF